MSMITELIEKLKDVSNTMQKIGMNRQASVIVDAYRTIEELSAKLHTVNMEQSSQYHHGGWIKCKDRLPEIGRMVLIEFADSSNRILMNDYNSCDLAWMPNDRYWLTSQGMFKTSEIIAWMPLPEPIEEGED